MEDTPTQLIFIINPKSGTKSKDQFANLIHEHIDPKRYKVEIEYTKYCGHASEIVSNYLKQGFNRFVAVGGDGTINEIASVLAKAKNGILGILPTGSGNGLARHINIPLNIASALDIINNPQIISIDYGKINKQAFFCTCGVGFDAVVGHKFACQKKRGLINYIKSIIKEFHWYKAKKYKITINKGEQKIKRRAFLVTVANAGQYGNNAYISPKADIQDGILNVSLIRPFPRYRIFGLGYRLMLKSIDKSKYTETFEATHIKIQRKKKGPVHFDGEPVIMKKTLKIKVVKQGLKVMVPVKW